MTAGRYLWTFRHVVKLKSLDITTAQYVRFSSRIHVAAGSLHQHRTWWENIGKMLAVLIANYEMGQEIGIDDNDSETALN